MKNLKSIYTKVHFGEQTFAQMPHKDIRNLYINSISFFLIFYHKSHIYSFVLSIFIILF